MKLPLLSFAALCTVTFGFHGTLAAETSPISLHVEASNRTEMAPKDRWTRTHLRKLHITVTNDSAEVVQLKIKHVIFGRDMLTHGIVKVSNGENPVEVKPHATATIDTAEGKCTESDQHFDAKAKKMTESSGATIAGSGVQALQGDKLLAEWYEPDTMKEQWAKAPPMIGSKEATAKPKTPKK